MTITLPHWDMSVVYSSLDAPEFVRDMRNADAEIARGQRGRPLEDVLADIEAEDSSKKPRHRRASS